MIYKYEDYWNNGLLFHISCFRKSHVFETRIHFRLFRSFMIAWEKLKVFAIFLFILWSQNVTSSLSAQIHCHYHYHYHYHYHLNAKKRIGYSWYSIPEFLVISFADSVTVFDSLSDCSFLCQYWYFC